MLSFIIVNYNTKDMTYQTLCYIENSIDSEPFEIILVDNASNDGSREFFTELMAQKDNFHYIYSENNGGFGYANNIGAKRAKGEILVLINPDIEIHQKGFDRFILQNLTDRIGILTPKILYPDGSLQPNCGGFATFSTHLFHAFKLGYYARRFHLVDGFLKIQKYLPIIKKTVFGKYLNNFRACDRLEKECDWVSGACIIIRKNLYEEIGGFDENFFMYVEDEELCRRVRKKGYAIAVNYDFTIVHLEGGTQEKKSSILGKAKRERYKSSIYNFYKHKGLGGAYLLKYFFLLVHFSAMFSYTLRFNFTSANDRLKLIRELFLYKFNENGITVVGYYGAGNIGDEFILHALLKKHKTNVSNFFILSSDSQATAQIHHAAMLNKKSIFGSLYSCLSSSKLIIGGGGLFLRSNTLSYYYYYCVLLYKFLNKKVIVSRVGIAKDALVPLKNRVLFKKIITNVDSISVRDFDSFDEIKKYLPEVSPKVIVEDDYVIDWLKMKSFAPISKEKKVGVVLMKLDDFDYSKIRIAIKSYLSQGYKIEYYIFFEREGDLEIAKKFSDLHQSNQNITHFDLKTQSFEDIMNQLRKNEVFLSMRLHPLILSYYGGVSCQAIAHNIKIKTFAQENNIGVIE